MPHRAVSSPNEVAECLSPNIAGKQTAPFEWPCLLPAPDCLQADAQAPLRHRYIALSVIYSSRSLCFHVAFSLGICRHSACTRWMYVESPFRVVTSCVTCSRGYSHMQSGRMFPMIHTSQYLAPLDTQRFFTLKLNLHDVCTPTALCCVVLCCRFEPLPVELPW